jgi:hypothetical protein
MTIKAEHAPLRVMSTSHPIMRPVRSAVCATLLGFLLAVTLFAYAGPGTPQRGHYIDLRSVNPEPAPVRVIGGSGNGGKIGGASTHRPALSVMLTDFARLGPKSADLEITITNASGLNQTIPWSPHQSVYEPQRGRTRISFTTMAVFFYAACPGQSRVRLPDTARLYGSSQTKGSLLTLKPGESSRLKVNISDLPVSSCDWSKPDFMPAVERTATVLTKKHDGWTADSKRIDF